MIVGFVIVISDIFVTAPLERSSKWGQWELQSIFLDKKVCVTTTKWIWGKGRTVQENLLRFGCVLHINWRAFAGPRQGHLGKATRYCTTYAHAFQFICNLTLSASWRTRFAFLNRLLGRINSETSSKCEAWASKECEPEAKIRMVQPQPAPANPCKDKQFTICGGGGATGTPTGRGSTSVGG